MIPNELSTTSPAVQTPPHSNRTRATRTTPPNLLVPVRTHLTHDPAVLVEATDTLPMVTTTVANLAMTMTPTHLALCPHPTAGMLNLPHGHRGHPCNAGTTSNASEQIVPAPPRLAKTPSVSAPMCPRSRPCPRLPGHLFPLRSQSQPSHGYSLHTDPHGPNLDHPNCCNPSWCLYCQHALVPTKRDPSQQHRLPRCCRAPLSVITSRIPHGRQLPRWLHWTRHECDKLPPYYFDRGPNGQTRYPPDRSTRRHSCRPCGDFGCRGDNHSVVWSTGHPIRRPHYDPLHQPSAFCHYSSVQRNTPLPQPQCSNYLIWQSCRTLPEQWVIPPQDETAHRRGPRRLSHGLLTTKEGCDPQSLQESSVPFRDDLDPPTDLASDPRVHATGDFIHHSAYNALISWEPTDFDHLRPYFDWVPINRIKQTLLHTTQNYHAAARVHHRKHFQTRFPSANVDTIFSDTPAANDDILDHGDATKLQLYVGCTSQLKKDYLMQSEPELREIGAPNILWRDTANAKTVHKMCDLFRLLRIKSQSIVTNAYILSHTRNQRHSALAYRHVHEAAPKILSLSNYMALCLLSI